MDYLSKANISWNLGHRKRKRQPNKENDAGDCEKGGFLKAVPYYRLSYFSLLIH